MVFFFCNVRIIRTGRDSAQKKLNEEYDTIEMSWLILACNHLSQEAKTKPDSLLYLVMIIVCFLRCLRGGGWQCVLNRMIERKFSRESQQIVYILHPVPQKNTIGGICKGEDVSMPIVLYDKIYSIFGLNPRLVLDSYIMAKPHLMRGPESPFFLGYLRSYKRVSV